MGEGRAGQGRAGQNKVCRRAGQGRAAQRQGSLGRCKIDSKLGGREKGGGGGHEIGGVQKLQLPVSSSRCGRKPSPGRNLLYNGIFGKSLRRSMPAQDVHLRGLSLLLRLGFVVSLEILELCDSRKRATTVHTSQYHHMPELTHVDSLPPSMHLACMSPLQSATSSST